MAEDKKISELIRVGNAGSPELSEVVKDSGNFKRQNNMTAEAEPTISADSDAGYSVGSFWYFNGVLWACKDSSVGAAVWGKVTVAPRSTDGSISIDNTDPSEPDLSAVKITSTDGTNIAEFVSEIESGEGRLKAVFTNANFENPFTILNSNGIRIGFFNKGNPALVTPQAAAIADATDATDVITQFNTLLAAMRAYGLIAE